MKNITWHQTLVSTEDRQKCTGQKGCVVWLTGLSGSGKSTIACELERSLVDAGHLAYILDGDNIRHGLNSDLGFSPEDRTENIRRISEVAALFADAGVIAITSFISPYRADRDRARAAVAPNKFFEIHLDVPVTICEGRDPKGLYKKARAGEIAEFTGISAPYEPPAAPELVLRTHELSVEEAASRIIALLKKAGIFGP
jgi:adenylylsulfate kinase